MATKVNFPKAGMGIDDGTVVRWLKALGDRVEEGEVVVEVETAKAIQEVQAPTTGRLVKITVGPGESTEVNTELGLIE